MGKVHGSLARAGKVKSQTPKVEPQEKKKTPKGRAKKRITYTRRFVNVTMTGGKRKGGGAKDVITLFHKPSVPSSVRVLTLLKQSAGTAQSTATEDQASSHDTHSKAQRTDFELDVTEAAPTGDQLQNIMEFIGKTNPSKLIMGARDEADAIKKLKDNGESFQRPVVVDWNNGRAVVGEDQSEILRLLKTIPKETDSV
ncbi:MAG: hypothetical protein M1820_003021 [Bogoriella megaspora]|nr:MAG: hypothetical protein M1820_003021 [Bogoriella megaspora]